MKNWIKTMVINYFSRIYCSVRIQKLNLNAPLKNVSKQKIRHFVFCKSVPKLWLEKTRVMTKYAIFSKCFDHFY